MWNGLTMYPQNVWPTLQGKSHLCIPFLGIARPQSQFPHSCVCEWFIYSQDQSTYFPAAEQLDRSWKYINLSQIYECRNWETEHFNYVLEITVSFLGIHKWEPDIYIGFSPALHLQCILLIRVPFQTITVLWTTIGTRMQPLKNVIQYNYVQEYRCIDV